MIYARNCQPIPPGQHTLPPLPYSYDALAPIISEESLRIHHDKLHQAYVDNLNRAELALVDARARNNFDQIAYWENQLAFNGSGHILHSIYWSIMNAPNPDGAPRGYTLDMIKSYFGSVEAFKAQFINNARTIQGSGWSILVYNPAFCHLEILPCEKHQNLTQWGSIPILVCDVWEHAYYLQYQNRRPDFITDWWSLIDWVMVERRLTLAKEAKMPLAF